MKALAGLQLRGRKVWVIGRIRKVLRLQTKGRAAIVRLAAFAVQSLAGTVTPPFYPRLILRQVIDIGYFSLPVVGLTALFTGMVLALQSYTGFSRFNAEIAFSFSFTRFAV